MTTFERVSENSQAAFHDLKMRSEPFIFLQVEQFRFNAISLGINGQDVGLFEATNEVISQFISQVMSTNKTAIYFLLVRIL